MDQKLIQVIAAIAQQQGIDLKEIGEEEFRSFALQVLNLFSLGNGGGEITNEADLQNVIADATAAVEQDPQKFAQTVYAGNSAAQEQQMSYAKWGAKLNYINYLRGNCPQGYEMRYFKKGGKLCKKCIEKAKKQKKNKNVKPEDTIDNFKRRYQVGGDVDDENDKDQYNTSPSGIPWKYNDAENPGYIASTFNNDSENTQIINYVIQKGDWLSKIARDNGTTVDMILADNPYLKKRNKYGDDIRVGDVIKLRTNLNTQREHSTLDVNKEGLTRQQMAEKYGVDPIYVKDSEGSSHTNMSNHTVHGSVGRGMEIEDIPYEVKVQRNGQVHLIPYNNKDKQTVILKANDELSKALRKHNGHRVNIRASQTENGKRQWNIKSDEGQKGPAKGILGLGWFN